MITNESNITEIAEAEAERRLADERLREFEERYRIIAETASDAFITIDEASMMLFVNPAAERMFGYTADEMLNESLLMLMPEEYHARHRGGIERYIATGRRNIPWGAVPAKGKHKDGSEFPLEISFGETVRDGKHFFTSILRDTTERKRAEAALRASEERFRAVFNQQFQFMAILSPEGVVLDINDLPLRRTGITREQVLGKLFWDTPFWNHLPEMQAGWRARLDQAARTGEPVLTEDLYQTADGETRIADASVTAVKDASGDVEFFIIQANDITERKQAEEARNRSEERYRQLADAMPQIVWTANTDGAFDYYNQRWFDYTGMTLEETRGWSWQPVIHPDDLQNCLERWTAAVETGENYEVEHRFRRASDGSYRWHLGRATPARDAEGRIVKWFGVFTDIHEQKLTEVELQTSQERYRALADAMPQLVWATDENGSHFYYNQQWYDFTGLTEEESMGYGFALALHPDDQERTLKRWERAWRAGESYSIEYRFYSRPQGIYRWFLGRAVPVRDAAGRIAQWVGTCTDINDQREMAEQLALMNAERERLFEEVSTPVVPVLPGVLTMPLIGSLDTGRMARASEAALAEVARTGAHTCIIDITGARILDSQAVANLSNLVAALKLIGADAIVTGVTAQAAQSLVGLGLDLSQMRTHRTLAQALSTIFSNSQGTGLRNNGTSNHPR
jgi:PAS domain S-box-containing protein